MATSTTTPQSGEGRPGPRLQNGFKISRIFVTGTGGDWLHHVQVSSFLDEKCIGRCEAKLIKESEYDSLTKHFFSAMDDQSNTMGDLAQLVLWSEGRWVFDGDWEGMKEYGDKMPVREELDKETRESRGKLSIGHYQYCKPVLFKPREDIPEDDIPFLIKRHWQLLFTDITVAKAYRGRNVDRAMVRRALEATVSLAREARRPLLAAVEPGCVQFKRFSISDPRGFEERYGPMSDHWSMLQGIKKRQEKFWLEMGFQRFEKGEHNRDLSNFFFWSGLFDLPEPRDIDLTELGKEQPEGFVVPDGTMVVPEKRDARRVKPKKKLKKPKPEPEKRPGKRDREEDDGGEVAADDQRPEKRYRLADDMDTDPFELPQGFEATDQICEGDIFDMIDWSAYDSD